jgi:type II secretory pathway pseudopilin PulG
MAGRRINRSRAGIEAAVLAVMMVIIALALAGIVWLFASTQTQTLARSAKIDIIDAKVVRTSTTGSGAAQVTVKNTGSVQVTISNTGVSVTGCTVTSPSSGATLNPGGTATFTLTCSGLPNPGERVAITVSGTAVGTNEPVAAVGQAVVM